MSTSSVPTDVAASPRSFVHATCGGTTEMPGEQVHGRLTRPHEYNDWVYCAKCDGYVARRECRWADTGENLAEFFDLARFEAPAPRESRLVYVAPILLAACGWLVGRLTVANEQAASIGLVAGAALGSIAIVLRRVGLK